MVLRCPAQGLDVYIFPIRCPTAGSLQRQRAKAATPMEPDAVIAIAEAPFVIEHGWRVYQV